MSEQIYDAEIAPKLQELAELCKKHGLSFVAVCEYATGQTGLTFTSPMDEDTTGATMFLAQTAALARGNFDALTFALMRHARKFGHSSMILKQLGVHESATQGEA